MTKRGLVLALLITLGITAVSSSAWAYWTANSVPGGAGAAGAALVGEVSAPTLNPDHGSIVVQWPASTLNDNTTKVTMYTVKRYAFGSSTPTAFATGSECDGIVNNYGCIDSNVPEGYWTYTVTPRFATNWVGVESSKSDQVHSDNLPPQNHVWMWVTP